MQHHAMQAYKPLDYCYVCTVKTLVLISVKLQIQSTSWKSSRDNWPTMPLLIETTPPTNIGHAPIQLPASWLWYLIQYPHLLLVRSTGSLSIMLHQLFDDTFCSTRLGPQSSQCNSFQYLHHMCSHIWLEVFFIFRGFFIKLIFIYLCHYKRVKNWILISRKF